MIWQLQHTTFIQSVFESETVRPRYNEMSSNGCGAVSDEMAVKIKKTKHFKLDDLCKQVWLIIQIQKVLYFFK